MRGRGRSAITFAVAAAFVDLAAAKGRRRTTDDAVKTAADKNKWGESRLKKKQSEGREG